MVRYLPHEYVIEWFYLDTPEERKEAADYLQRMNADQWQTHSQSVVESDGNLKVIFVMCRTLEDKV